MEDIGLNIGDEYNRPNNFFPCQQQSSPGVDTELVEEVQGVIDTLIYDDGTETGYVLVQET